jgi:UDP-GlcNAc:undecaprenyl-phosphate/decaprenyl-phosphate GlcNAc-1-phosphate transferase
VKDYVLTLLVAAAATYMLTPLVRRLAAQIGAMKQPRERDVHVVPVATLGGLAMYGGLAAGLLISEQIPQLRLQAFTNTGMLPGLLLAGGLLVVIGFIDDRWGMGALTKGAGQVAAGAILVATGTTLSWFPLPGGNTFLPDTDQRTVLTILIVVATINAVNFIDGLDGLASGIVGIAAVSFFIYYYSLTRVIHMTALAAPALASAILIGMCIGFLPHNFSPAKIFMGDTGSMLLGLLLAYAPISAINSLPEGNLTSEANRYPVILPLLLPAALLIIPYADLLLAVVRRTRAGQSPFAPDRKHLHHRLLDIGHSQRTSVLIMYLWAALFSGSVVWLSVEKTVQPKNASHHGEPIFVFVLITVGAVAALLLMSMPRLRWWQRARVAAGDAGAVAGPISAPTVSAGAVLAGAVSANGVSANGVSANGISGNGVSANGGAAGVSADEMTASLGARVEAFGASPGHLDSLAFWRSPDQESAGPARSIIGTVPPAVTGHPPAAPELRRPSGAPEHADNGWQPPEPKFP